MGVIAGVAIGLLCRRFLTAAGWSVLAAIVATAIFAFSAVRAEHVEAGLELSIFPMLAVIAVPTVVLSALATLGIKRGVARLRGGRRPPPPPPAFGRAPPTSSGDGPLKETAALERA